MGLPLCLNKLETISTSEERHVPYRQDASPIVDDVLEQKMSCALPQRPCKIGHTKN